MIFPFFKRVSGHKRFKYEPRYYDSVKEEINIRTEQIKRELNKDTESNSLYKENISSAFTRRSRKNSRVSGMQAVIIALFVGTFVGYFIYGNVALWTFLVLFPVYIFIRTRKYFS